MVSKLIVALDFDNQAEALTLVDKLNPTECALKVGSELYTLLGASFVKLLIQRQFKVFLDLKFYDIPNTVARAVKVAADLGVWMLNVHASGGSAMMKAAREALNTYEACRPLLIAVTVLTSMAEQELKTLGISDSLEQHVTKLARLAQDAKLDGVVCSVHEVAKIKAACGHPFLTVTPGIRLPNSQLDDQSRIITPEMAAIANSDYWVVGRPITKASDPITVVRELLRYG